MTEKLTFEVSGLVSNEHDKEEIEFWGHDAGEFFIEVIEEIIGEMDMVQNEVDRE